MATWEEIKATKKAALLNGKAEYIPSPLVDMIDEIEREWATAGILSKLVSVPGRACLYAAQAIN